MMNKKQAIEYGKLIGVKFYILNQHGGLMGGAKTEEQAKGMLEEFTQKWPDMDFRIVAAGA